MEEVYKKVGNRYVFAGYNGPDISEGIWLVQKRNSSKTQTNLLWKLGDLKRPVDVMTQAALASMADDIALYVVKLQDENSEEYKAAKKMLGSWMRGPIVFGNCSAYDIAHLILRRIAEEVETAEMIDWHTVMMSYREDVFDHVSQQEYDETVKGLWKFTDWLTKNGYELKQKK